MRIMRRRNEDEKEPKRSPPEGRHDTTGDGGCNICKSELLSKKFRKQRRWRKEMVYPKELMRKKDLIKMGIPEAYIDRAITDPNQSFAFKINPMKKNSPYIFDTKKFEKWREEDEKQQMKAKKMRMQVM